MRPICPIVFLLAFAAAAAGAPDPQPAVWPASSLAPEPAINSPRITGATPGRPFLFRIPATGEPPLAYTAQNLPAGLSLDASSGIVSGALESAGSTDVAITVTNARGAAAGTITIVGGDRKLAITPPMGWNSWNAWGIVVDDARVRAAADALVASGLAAQGYQYVNIDDSWTDRRGPDGVLKPNKRFPDMKALAGYVHAKGLKIGIYSSPGPKTCQGYEGSYNFEQIDARTFADWGFDYLKYDWCSYLNILDEKTASRQQMQEPFRPMREALDACGRDIVYSLCQYGMAGVWEWGRDVGANLWRTTTDIDDSWDTMSNIGFNQDGKRPFAGPGGWNDPDMLVVGQVGWGPSLHATRLTKNEQITHITLWCLLAAPLLIGCDLSQLDEFTRSILANPEVIAVNQDPLGKQASRITRNGLEEVWYKPLADGSLAVGLFNRRDIPSDIALNLPEIGLTAPQRFRNLWTRQDIPPQPSFTIPPHGAILLKLAHP
jgi:alpha-galactosidase